MAQPARTDERARPAILPASLVILMLTALVAVGMTWWTVRAFDAAREAGTFDADTRRAVAFGVLFNVAVAAGLGLAWLLDMLAVPVRLVLRRPFGRIVGRAITACLPLALLGAGQLALNPHLTEVLRQARASFG